MKLSGRNFLKELDFTPEELLYLLDLAANLKKAKKSGAEKQYLKGKNIALLFEKDSTRTRCAFEVAAYDQGANVTWLGANGSQMGKKESLTDTARVLSRFFDGIEYRGFEQDRVETIAKFSNVPVWNGLTNEWHPTQLLADLLTMREACPKPLSQQTLAYLGDARYNTGNSLMIGAALMGMNFRSIGPVQFRTSDEVFRKAQEIASKTGASITRTNDIDEGVKNADFIYTDVWLSMGEASDNWKARIEALAPYRVTREVMLKSGNPACKFLHCLPSFHDRNTEIGEKIFQTFGLDCMEVTDDVFESESSLVFDEAENRLHTIKAIMVGTLGTDSFIKDGI